MTGPDTPRDADSSPTDPLLDLLAEAMDDLRAGVPAAAVEDRLRAAGPPGRVPELLARLRRLRKVEEFAHTTDADGPADESPPDLPDYEVIAKLGGGGMGVVYLARQRSLNRPVALKLIAARALGDRSAVARFRLEAEAVANLQGPNIVAIYEVGEANGRPYMALEYCPGGSLAEALGGVPQPPRVAAELAEALARAVALAHARGVVHRDLKPGNVLIAGDRPPSPREANSNDPTLLAAPAPPPLSAASLRVSDFGLARRLEQDSGLTRTGAVVGTPSYMAPEQAEGRKVGRPADVWALGAILYEMLTGRPPFRGSTTLETLDWVRTREPVPVRAVNPACPRDLETVALKCLEKRPERRYASAADLADDLRRYLDGRPIVARPVGPLGRAVKWARRRPTQAALAAVVVLAVFAVLGVSLWYNARLIAANEAERGQRVKAEQSLDAALQSTRDLAALTFDTLRRAPDQTFLDPVTRKQAEVTQAAYERLTALGPDDPANWEGLGEFCYMRCRAGDRQDLSDKAVAAFERAVELREGRLRADPGSAAERSALAARLRRLADLRYARGEFDAGAGPIGRSQELYDALVNDFPGERNYRLDRANVLTTRGRGAWARGRYEEALAWLLGGVADLEQDAAAPTPRGDSQTRLTDAYATVADCHGALGDHRKAVDYWTKALADRVTLGPGRLRQTFQLSRAWSYAELGDHRASEADLAGLTAGESDGMELEKLINLAAVNARNVRSAREDAALSAAERARLAEEYAGRAMDRLRTARERGLLPTTAEWERWAKELPALKELQGRPDFEAFVKGLPR
jgi:tetratricopeptide (TPR) repeat protein